MQSNEIKKALEELDSFLKQNMPEDPMEYIRTKTMLLNVIALNEVNWSMFYLKEEMKEQTAVLRSLKAEISQIEATIFELVPDEG